MTEKYVFRKASSYLFSRYRVYSPFEQPGARYTKYYLSESRVGVKIWNKIPNEFKTLSKGQVLDNEHSYLDIENISSKLKDCKINPVCNLTMSNYLVFNFLYLILLLKFVDD